MFKNSLAVAVSAVAVTVSAPSVFAAEGAAAWDYSALSSGIDFSGISVGVMAVAGGLATVYVGIKGVNMFLAFLRR